MITKQDVESGQYSGAAWFDPVQKKLYGGHAGTYQGGILTDVATIESKVVLEELLGLMRPDYTLEQCVTVVNTPELVLSVDTETIASGHADVQPLEESVIRNKTFVRKNMECDLNEAHIVIEDRAAMKASHDLLRLNIADCAREIAKMRNAAINTEMLTSGDTDGLNWTDSDDLTDSPLIDITTGIKTVMCNGYKPDFVALNPIDWNYFLNHEAVQMMAMSGILTMGQTPTLTVPGYPSVKIVIDCAVTYNHCFVGSKRAIILAQGPTESVRYRHEPKRYTGFIARDYVDVELCVTGAFVDITPIES
jgi:hypothetical protein